MDYNIRRSRTCAVCHEATNTFNLNYGANSCLSCRAFFRRVIQQNAESKFKVCKGLARGQMCEIKVDNRKRCKQCRFQACLQAGMDPNSVLNEDQYKKRFRKMLKKKTTDSEQSNSNSDDMDINTADDLKDFFNTAQNPESSSEDVLVHLPHVQLTNVRDNLSILSFDESFLSQSFQKKIDGFNLLAQEVKNKITPEDVDSMKCFDLVTRVRESWNRICTQFRRDQSEFSDLLLELHRNSSSSSITKTVFRNHLETLGNFFVTFAKEQPEFGGLPSKDQELLLKSNTRLYIQYFLGRYFYAGSGLKQQQWLMLCQVPDYLTEASYIRFIPLTTFNEIVPLFKDEEVLSQYQKHAKRLAELTLSYNCNCCVTMLCIFNTLGVKDLENVDLINKLQDFIFDCAEWSVGKFNCGQANDLKLIVKELVEMADAFDSVVNWKSSDSNPCSSVSSVLDRDFFTWCGEKLDEVREVFPMGSDIISEVVMFNLEVPVSKHFYPHTYAVFEARFAWIIQQLFPQDGRGVKLESIIRRNLVLAMALISLKFFTMKNGKEQFGLILGNYDAEVLAQKMAKIKRSRPLKQMTFLDLSSIVEEHRYVEKELVDALDAYRDYLNTHQRWIAACAAVLFLDLESPKMPKEFGMKQRPTCVARALHNANQIDNDEDIYAQFCQGLEKLLKFGQTLRKIAQETESVSQPETD